MKRIKIGKRIIGEGRAAFIIAEAGVNHNGSLGLAKRLVKIAALAGADAVKFQTFKTDELVTQYAAYAKYQKRITSLRASQYEMLKSLELSHKTFQKLSEYSKQAGIMFLSTPFDFESADFLEQLGVPAFKLSSSDVTNLPLLEHIAKKHKPILLSTGMSSMQEIKEAVNAIRFQGNKDIILLQCTSGYPVDPRFVNLRVISTLKEAFSLPVGFSDHSLSTVIPSAAVALGACVVEKHFTIDRNLPGSDHKASLEPDQLREMIKHIREVETALGSSIKKIVSTELDTRKVARRSVVARVPMPKGTLIKGEMLAFKRPGTGLAPKYFYKIVDTRAKFNIKKDEQISLEDIR